MRKLCLTLVVAIVSAVQAGCVVPIWSVNPDERVRQMIFTSESYRQVPEIWERIWGLDLPDLATPFRTHGGVI